MGKAWSDIVRKDDEARQRELAGATGVFDYDLTPEEKAEQQKLSAQHEADARRAAQKEYRERVKAKNKALEAQLSAEDLKETVEALRHRRKLFAARRAKAEALLPQEEREALAAERAEYRARYYARTAGRKPRATLSPEEEEARAEAKRAAARERARRRAAEHREALVAAGKPLPARGRPRTTGPAPEATPEERREILKARNREAQRRFQQRKREKAKTSV